MNNILLVMLGKAYSDNVVDKTAAIKRNISAVVPFPNPPTMGAWKYLLHKIADDRLRTKFGGRKISCLANISSSTPHRRERWWEKRFM
jgi:hypothetical protein